MTAARRLRGAVVVVALACLLAACGFHLRGTYQLPEGLTPIHVDAPAGSAVAGELRSTLRRQGEALATSADAAASTLRILDEREERRVLSVGSGAKVDEYEVRKTVRWTLERAGAEDEEADELIAPTELRSRRDYRFDPSGVLSKQAEERSLYEDMSGQLAQQILFRLRSADAE